LLVYWVIVAVSHALEYYRGFQERELRTVELERRLAEARLEALQTQLNPHFLFNTLNAISALMHKDVEAADRMIVRLSELLRHALDTVGTQEVPLRQELAFLASYLEIEQTRFGDRLVVRQAIEPAALDAMVPSLVLQPLVENAIKHGIEPHAKPGVIELVARREGAKLRLEVRDNGRGLRREEPWRSGVGLSNTKARLEALYGDSHCLEFSDRADGGLVVQMTIPWKTDGALHESAGPVGRN
jgi:LytS/YehU family sensor histidine kinase